MSVNRIRGSCGVGQWDVPKVPMLESKDCYKLNEWPFQFSHCQIQISCKRYHPSLNYQWPYKFYRPKLADPWICNNSSMKIMKVQQYIPSRSLSQLPVPFAV